MSKELENFVEQELAKKGDFHKFIYSYFCDHPYLTDSWLREEFESIFNYMYENHLEANLDDPVTSFRKIFDAYYEQKRKWEYSFELSEKIRDCVKDCNFIFPIIVIAVHDYWSVDRSFDRGLVQAVVETISERIESVTTNFLQNELPDKINNFKK